jgi:hypothetical protein
MFQIKVKKRPKKLLKQLEKIAKGDFTSFTKTAGPKIRDDIISNIKHKTTPEGNALKKNKPETLRIKKRMGWGQLSLIAQFRLLISKSTYIIKAKKKSVELTLAEVRKNVGRILEAKGYRFFGISDKVRTLIFKEWRMFIKRGFQ